MLKLTEASLKWSLEHLLEHGDTNIFPIPFEYAAIAFDWANVADYLTSVDIHAWQTRSFHKYLVPKHRYGFRISTRLDPLDTLIYTALTYDVREELETSRIATSRKIVFSHRVKRSDNHAFFNEDNGYVSFQNRSKQLALKKTTKHVVVADIADFFPRLYLHSIENMLDSSTTKRDHSTAIKKLIKKWNQNVSYGIPVGQVASSLIAETSLNDVDQALLTKRTLYCRYVDDFRIFCNSERDAYEKLSWLATVLFENHGLTLQQAKTKIMSKTVFRRVVLRSYEEKEIESLKATFNDILEDIGADNPYAPIDFDELDIDDQARIKQLNLEKLLKEQCKADILDLPMIRFILRRMGQLNNTACIDIILRSMDSLYPAFTSVIDYFNNLTVLSDAERKDIGKSLLQLLKSKSIVHLPFHRLYLFNLFANNTSWQDQRVLIRLLDKETDDVARRKLILAIGKSKNRGWFRANRRAISQLPPWQRRAFLRGASCMAPDELHHWYNALSNLDVLDKAVIKYSKANPIAS